MRTIKLNKGTIDLPSGWDDLQYNEKLFAFDLLHQVMEGIISPIEFRIRMLGYLTGYKPQSGICRFLLMYLIYLLQVPFVALWYLIRLGRVRFSGYWGVWKSRNKPKLNNRDIINYNLYRLSELIDFAFTLEDHRIIPNRVFLKNPIPILIIDDELYQGRKFNRDIAPFTDISAREFSDCYDLYAAYISTSDKELKSKSLNRIISILYPWNKDYNLNMVSDHVDSIDRLPESVKFGILYWFTGIVDYYLSHPVYSLLFRSTQSEESESIISLGMGEIILMLEKEGYQNEEFMNVNKFFDAQIAELKNKLSTAVSHGAKPEDLANSTGLSLTDLNRLI